MEHFYQGIDGWFGFKGVYDLVVKELLRDDANFVEVGSWAGRSAAYLAVEIKNSGARNVHLYCVDTWKGSRDAEWMEPIVRQHGGSMLPKFLENTKPVADVLWPIEKSSLEAAKDFEDESLDFVMIDGAHDYESVWEDIRAWLPKVRPGGVLAGDDVSIKGAWPQVWPAVIDSLPQSEVVIDVASNAWVYRKVRADRGRWLHKPPPPRARRHAENTLIVVPTCRMSTELQNCLNSLDDYRQHLVVLDQTADGLGLWFPTDDIGVFRAPKGSMTFSQVQNWMQAEAFERHVDWLVFHHDDAAAHDRNVIAEMLDAMVADPKIGVGFSNYDALAVFNMNAVRRCGPWDETFPWYWADCDYYHRMRRAGFRCEPVVDGARVGHAQSLTLKSMPGDERGSVDQKSEWAKAHYIHKWGGDIGHEQWGGAYNGRP